MIKQYHTFSNFDVFAVVRELNILLSKGIITNIYEVEDLLIFKINTSQDRKILIIKSDSRMNLTNYEYPIPKYPSQYILSLRKLLKNRQILNISQHNFDRIVIIELSNRDTEPWKFIIELFNKGNYLLIDNLNLLKIARKYRKFKDRDILPNNEFNFPSSKGKDFLTINENEFYEIIKNSDEEIVRILAREINISGLYSEEICLIGGINKNSIGKELGEEDLKKLFKSFKSLRNRLLFGEINAHIVYDNNGIELCAIPFEIEIFKGNKKKFFKSFNEAVDEFYSKLDSEELLIPRDFKIEENIKAQKKILQNQLNYLTELELRKKKYYKYGDFIYANFKSLENLINVILNARSKGYTWEQINEKLEVAKTENIQGTEYFKKLNPATQQLIVNIENEEISLDLRKSLGENANLIYSKGKKADKKIKGSLPAIEQTKVKIHNLNLEKESLELKMDFLIKKPKKKWFEKFRWFISSDGFLIIAGRDATSNELIFKKYIEPNDLVFHTDFSGSPLTILKNPDNKQISEKNIQEAADFTASFSRAWKETWGVVEVFYVLPNQISKSPPSGEYLPKGSFMIFGKKNFIKNAKTELAISLKMVKVEMDNNKNSDVFYPTIIYGPKSAIEANTTDKYIIIKPSKSGVSTGNLAKEIKQFFVKTSEIELKKYVELLAIEEINLCLPPGYSIIVTSN